MIGAVVLIAATGCTETTSRPVTAASARASTADPTAALPDPTTALPDPTAGSPSTGPAHPPCAATPISDQQQLLSLSDVWGSDNGGHASTTLDVTTCVGQRFSEASFVCRLPFPWLAADQRDRQLAGLGAETVRTSRLVSPAGAEVTETVVTFPVGQASGARTLAQAAVDCGGSATRRATGSTSWSTGDSAGRTEPGTALAVVSSGPSILAVEFTDTRLTRAAETRIVDLAVQKAAGW